MAAVIKMRCSGCQQMVGWTHRDRPTWCSLRCYVTEKSMTPSFERDELIALLYHHQHASLTDLSQCFGLSRQHIHQILKVTARTYIVAPRGTRAS